MPNPLIIYGDAQRIARDALRPLLAARGEPEALGAVVSTRDYATGAPLPHVKVALVGGASRSSTLAASALVRVTVWHRDEGLALRLAALCEGLLIREGRYAAAGGAVPVPDGDPDTGTPLAFTTITARLRPHQLD